jgi:hypothetical protein
MLVTVLELLVVTNNDGTANLNEQVAAEAPLAATPLAQPGPAAAAAQLTENLFAIEEEVPSPHITEGMLLLSLFF